VAALAYLVPPLSGLAAYFAASSARVRWHGLQAILLGLVWPAAMYLGAAVSPGVTQSVTGVGVLAWLVFMAATALGRDPRWPFVGAWLRRLAADPPGGSGGRRA
jgi:hypothetical protein